MRHTIQPDFLHKSGLFKKGIRVFGIIKFINPEHGIEFIAADIGYIVGEPHRHIDEGRIFAVEFEGYLLTGSDFPYFNARFTFDYGEALNFSGMI